MKKIILAASALLVFAGTGAIAAEYNIVQPEKSRIAFVSKQMGVAVNGTFPKFAAQVAFDPANPATGKVNISIDLASIDAGSKDANDEVVGKQWFNVKSFPAATFVSTGIKSVAGGKYEVTGPLTIKGKSQPVTATFTAKAEGASATFDGSFVLKRIDYAVGEGPWADVSIVANDVTVNFHVVATSGAPATPAASANPPSKVPPKTK
ncbi:MAG: YceI family protein [Betaproteobacteria bacterium]